MIYRFEFVFDIDTYSIKQAYELITTNILENNYVDEWKEGVEHFYHAGLHPDGIIHRHHYTTDDKVILNFVVGEYAVSRFNEIDRLFKLCCSYKLLTSVYKLSQEEFLEYKLTHPYVIEKSDAFAQQWATLYEKHTGNKWENHKKN